MIQATLSDSNYSDAESLLEWDERAAEFVAAEKKKEEKKVKEEEENKLSVTG